MMFFEDFFNKKIVLLAHKLLRFSLQKTVGSEVKAEKIVVGFCPKSSSLPPTIAISFKNEPNLHPCHN